MTLLLLDTWVVTLWTGFLWLALILSPWSLHLRWDQLGRQGSVTDSAVLHIHITYPRVRNIEHTKILQQQERVNCSLQTPHKASHATRIHTTLHIRTARKTNNNNQRYQGPRRCAPSQEARILSSHTRQRLQPPLVVLIDDFLGLARIHLRDALALERAAVLARVEHARAVHCALEGVAFPAEHVCLNVVSFALSL